jgi:hypothetical protein
MRTKGEGNDQEGGGLSRGVLSERNFWASAASESGT